MHRCLTATGAGPELAGPAPVTQIAEESRLSRESVSDAPDGDYVVRVSAPTDSGDSSLNDDPDTIESSVEGRSYTAAA